MTTIEMPRSPRATRSNRRTTRGNTEMAGWLFMRISGIVLVVLVLGHLIVNLLVDDGISGINFAFVAGKWADIRWQIWDLLMLWLAMIHGANGMRTIINDYAEKDSTRRWLKLILYVAAVVVVVLGTMVIFTFEPCMLAPNGEPLPGAFCP